MTRRLKLSIMIKMTAVLLIAAMLFTVSSCDKKNTISQNDIPDNEQIFLISDDAPNCNMIISDEVFGFLSDNDDYSYILDMMNDYFYIIINEEIDPNIVYIKPINERIDSEVRLEEVYRVSNKISLIIKLANVGKLMLDEKSDESLEQPAYQSQKNDLTEKDIFYNEVILSLNKSASAGAVYSIQAIKDDFKRKTAEIYGSKELLNDDKVKSLKYGDYVIKTDEEDGISIVCGSLDSVLDALNYFLSEYIQMGTSDEGKYLIDIPDSAVHVGHYLRCSIADKPVEKYSIAYYCDKQYYDSRENASYLKNYILKNFGFELLTGETSVVNKLENKIVLGKTNLEVSKRFYSEKYDIMDYEIVQQGSNLFIMGGSDWAIRYAIDYLIDNFFSKERSIPRGFSTKGNFSGQQIFPMYGDSEIRIMSNNVWDYNDNTIAWRDYGENCFSLYRFKNMAKAYLAYSPDIISLQELNMRTAISNGMQSEINLFGKQYRYVDRFSSGYAAGCEERNCTPVLYNSETLTLLAAGEKQYPREGNNLQSKSYTWGYFEKKDTGFRFLVFSTHLWWKSDKSRKGSSDIRINQMMILNEKVDELIEMYSCPCFVMGDFNCNITSREFGEFEKLGFKDCHSIAEDYASNECGRFVCNRTRFSYKQNAGTYKKNGIDHIMVKNLKNAKVLCYNYVTPNFYGKLSDHAPVYIDVKVY
jgi:Exonuclease III